MWIKICGITSIEVARCCMDAGADALGFVFAESRRNISVEAAGRIVKSLPSGVQKVGVFVDLPHPEVAEIADSLKLDLLQFHGKESPGYCRGFPGKAVKSFRVSGPSDLEIIKDYRGSIRACLLDSYEQSQVGGTGRTWDWSILGDKIDQAFSEIPLIVAGGLSVPNVRAALDKIKPYGVDTSSGVEINGQKDCTLIRNFITEVRRWEDEQLTR